MDRDSQRLAFSAGAAGRSVRDFFALTRAVQDRFISATRGGAAAPPPILKRAASRGRVFAWLGAGLLLLPAPLVVSRLGFGDVASALAVHGVPLLVVYASLFAAGVFSIFRALSIASAARRLPFAPAVYVFPACIVDARSHKLEVHAMTDAVSAERSAAGVAITLPDGARFDFTLGTEEAERALRELAATRDALKEGPTSARARVVADPLFDGALSSPLGPTAPLARSVPLWSQLSWAIAVLVGGSAAAALFLTRNASSDSAMFAAVSQANDIATYQRYLALGGRRSAEVADVLLPRVELREAEKAGTVEAIQAYAASHPGSKIADEVAVALRRAMLVKLEESKREGTVTALAAFARRFPDHGLVVELAAARHALFVRALDAYLKVAPEKDAAIAKQMQKALAHAEMSGPAAEVRFRVRTTKSMASADAQAEKSRFFGGPDTLPSRYFDAAHVGPRAEELQKELASKLAAAFPPDILAFHAAPPLDADVDPSKVTVPTLVLEYTPEWSQSFGISAKPRGIFAGVTMQLDAALLVPRDAAPWKLRHTAWRGPEAWRFRKEMEDAKPGELEAKVYAAMSDAIFEQFQKKALGAFFQPPPAPPKK